MSTLTLTPTSNSITAEVNSFYQDDRIFEWYLNGALKATTSSALVVNSYTFTPVPFWSPYHVDVQIYNSDHTALIETVSDDTDTTFASLAAWDWNISNGNATAEQTQEAYTAASTKQQTKKFNHAVWNDIIAYVIEARQASGQPLVVNTDMTMQANDPLTAIIMNAAVKNVDYPWWTWRDDPDDYDVDGRYISYLGRLAFQRGDVVFGRYIIELVKNLNIMRNVYSGRDISSLEVQRAISLVPNAYLRVPKTEELYETHNIPLVFNSNLQLGTEKLLNTQHSIPLVLNAELETTGRHSLLDAIIAQTLTPNVTLTGGVTGPLNADFPIILRITPIAARAQATNFVNNQVFQLVQNPNLITTTGKLLNVTYPVGLGFDASIQFGTQKYISSSYIARVLASGKLSLEEAHRLLANWQAQLSPHNAVLELGDGLQLIVSFPFALGNESNLELTDSAPLAINSAANLGHIAIFASLAIKAFEATIPINIAQNASISTANSKTIQAENDTELNAVALCEIVVMGGLKAILPIRLTYRGSMGRATGKTIQSTENVNLAVASLLERVVTKRIETQSGIYLAYSASAEINTDVSHFSVSEPTELAVDSTLHKDGTKYFTAALESKMPYSAKAAVTNQTKPLQENSIISISAAATGARIPTKRFSDGTIIELPFVAGADKAVANILPQKHIPVTLDITSKTATKAIAGPLTPKVIDISLDISQITATKAIAGPLPPKTYGVSLELTDIEANKAIAQPLPITQLDAETSVFAHIVATEGQPSLDGDFRATLSPNAILALNASMKNLTQETAIAVTTSAELQTGGKQEISASIGAQLGIETANLVIESGGWIYPDQTGNSLYIRQAYHIDDNNGSLYFGYKMPIQTDNSLYIRQLYYFYQDGHTIYTSWINPVQTGDSLYIRQAWENITDEEDGE